MRKILLSTAAIALVFAFSCNKSDNSKNNGNGNSNDSSGLVSQTYMISPNVYNATGVGGSGNSLIAISGSGAAMQSMSFRFSGSSLPTANGSYKVVSSSPGANEIAVVATSSIIGAFNDQYNSTGYGNSYVKVKIIGGRVSIDMPKVWAKKTLSGATDSVQLSANVTQN